MPDPRPAWHALFAPLPADAPVMRKPVLPPELRGNPSSAPIAGWEHLSVQLSAPGTGLRHVMFTLDADGRVISGGDWVLYTEGKRGIHENVGGRFEPDGRFLGTRWRTVSEQEDDEDEARILESVSSPPSEADIAAIKALAEEVLRRAGEV